MLGHTSITRMIPLTNNLSLIFARLRNNDWYAGTIFLIPTIMFGWAGKGEPACAKTLSFKWLTFTIAITHQKASC